MYVHELVSYAALGAVPVCTFIHSLLSHPLYARLTLTALGPSSSLSQLRSTLPPVPSSLSSQLKTESPSAHPGWTNVLLEWRAAMYTGGPSSWTV